MNQVTSTNRAYVICHMMLTMDDRSESGVEGVDIFEEFLPTYNKIDNSFSAEAWMCGRKTMEMFASDTATQLPQISIYIPEGNFVAKTDAKRYAICVDTKGLLRWNSDVISDNGDIYADHLITVVTGQTPKDFLSYLRSKGISYIFGGTEKIDFEKVLVDVKNLFEINKVVLSGGGILNGSMVEYIDEISLLRVPIHSQSESAHYFFGKDEKSEELWKFFEVFEEKDFENNLNWLRYKKV